MSDRECLERWLPGSVPCDVGVISFPVSTFVCRFTAGLVYLTESEFREHVVRYVGHSEVKSYLDGPALLSKVKLISVPADGYRDFEFHAGVPFVVVVP